MDRQDIHPGDRFGRWTVQNDCLITAKGERKWLCLCECGAERYVLERSLKSGGSLSCGCLRKEKAAEAVSYDLNGRVFGELTVLHPSEHQRKNGGVWWTCQCSCGSKYECPASLLITGRRTHCGCKTNRGRPTDITDQRFERLTALYPQKERDERGSVVWHCRCDCGNEIDIPYNDLLYCNTKSCGCQKKEHDKALKNYLTHVEGTSLDMIKSKKLPADNTTGYKGVYLIRGKYMAKIVFQKKQYFLGTYEKIEDAANARRKAEEVLFDEFAEYYASYSSRAEASPEWAKENPIQIHVKKEGADLSVEILPSLTGDKNPETKDIECGVYE